MTKRQQQLQFFVDVFTVTMQSRIDRDGGLQTEEAMVKVLFDPLSMLVRNLPNKEKKILYRNNKGLESICEIKGSIETRD